jgi:hypothetical protein
VEGADVAEHESQLQQQDPDDEHRRPVGHAGQQLAAGRLVPATGMIHLDLLILTGIGYP